MKRICPLKLSNVDDAINSVELGQFKNRLGELVGGFAIDREEDNKEYWTRESSLTGKRRNFGRTGR